MTPAKRNDPDEHCPHIDGCPAAMVDWTKYVDERFRAIERTLTATEVALRDRLSNMNNLHEQIREQRESLEKRLNLCIQRPEYDANHKQLEIIVSHQQEVLAEQKGRASMSSVYFAYLAAAVSGLIGLVGLIHSFMK